MILSIPLMKTQNYLFGNSKFRTPENSIFGELGLLNDVSKEVILDLDSIKKFAKEENNFSFDELFGFSYVLYNQLQKTNPKEQLVGDQ